MAQKNFQWMAMNHAFQELCFAQNCVHKFPLCPSWDRLLAYKRLIWSATASQTNVWMTHMDSYGNFRCMLSAEVVESAYLGFG